MSKCHALEHTAARLVSQFPVSAFTKHVDYFAVPATRPESGLSRFRECYCLFSTAILVVVRVAFA